MSDKYVIKMELKSLLSQKENYANHTTISTDTQRQTVILSIGSETTL